jgi:hypothetical protein
MSETKATKHIVRAEQMEENGHFGPMAMLKGEWKVYWSDGMKEAMTNEQYEKVAGAASPGESAPTNEPNHCYKHPVMNPDCNACYDEARKYEESLKAGESSAEPPKPIDGKFGILGDRLVNLVSLQPIPEDEPLFLLRGRDNHAYDTLMHYLRLNADGDDLHQEGIKQVIRKFIAFATGHPERMKQPGITRDLKLESAAPAAPDKPLPTQLPTHVIVAVGEGAQASVIFGGDIHEAVHKFFCVCGNGWRECSSTGVTQDTQRIDDPEEWSKDEDGRQFSICWEHETGKVTLYKTAAPAPPGKDCATPQQNRAHFALSPVETHVIVAKEDQSMIATLIANEFSQQLRKTLTAEQMDEVVRLNKEEADKVGVCHSHDFCDANTEMIAALETLGITRVTDALWNEAWKIAKGAEFKPLPLADPRAQMPDAGEPLAPKCPICSSPNFSVTMMGRDNQIAVCGACDCNALWPQFFPSQRPPQAKLVCPECKEEIRVPGVSQYEHEECVWPQEISDEYSRRVDAYHASMSGAKEDTETADFIRKQTSPIPLWKSERGGANG